MHKNENDQSFATVLKKRHEDNMNPQQRIEFLLTEGTKVTCDDTNQAFKDNVADVPPFYDEEKFKRGQKFYYKHLFSMFFAKLLGLLVTLCVPSILKILMLTEMSDTPYKAYKRYMATIFHMSVWYKKDFTPSSDLWKSLRMVRNMHNSASGKACKSGLWRITQKDMAVTQFGFMGFVLCRTKKIGIHKATDEELEAFIHVWRVIGYLMGMEDRFNICSGSIEEVREMCNILLEKVFVPEISKQDPDFLRMTSALIKGMWVMNPFLDVDGFMTYLYVISCGNNNNDVVLRNEIIKNNKNFVFMSIRWTVDFLKHDFYRYFLNFLQVLGLWLMTYFPYLAYYRYGVRNSRVKIFRS